MSFVASRSIFGIHCAALLTLALLAAGPLAANERSLRVAIVENSPPQSYVNQEGKPAGFMVDLADALCESMRVKCTYHFLRIDEVIDALASDKAEYAAVTLLATPERQKKVLFSKPFYRSLSIWLAKPSVVPGTPNVSVAVVRGSVQAKYAEMQGWKVLPVATHLDQLQALANGNADTALAPMLTAVAFTSDKRIQALGLQSMPVTEPMLSGDVRLSVNPRHPEIKEQLDAAIDQVKSDGRFDRINTRHLPFRLQ